MAEIATAQAHGRELVIGPLAVGSVYRRASGWWGMLTLVLTEAFLFANLLFAYYYLAVQYGRSWLPTDLPSFRLSGPNTVILLASAQVVVFSGGGAWYPPSAPALWALHPTAASAATLAIALLVGAVFAGLTLWSWRRMQLDR